MVVETTKQDLDVIPVTQSTYMQKNKLKFLLGKIDQLLGITPEQRNWSVRGRLKVCMYMYLLYVYMIQRKA